MTESESDLCSKINLAEMRIDYALKEYKQCKDSAFLAGTKWDEEMTRLINKVKDEYDCLFGIASLLKFGIDSSVIEQYDTAEGRLAIIQNNLEVIETYCQAIRISLNLTPPSFN